MTLDRPTTTILHSIGDIADATQIPLATLRRLAIHYAIHPAYRLGRAHGYGPAEVRAFFAAIDHARVRN
jgi:hypothetical protein